MMNNNDQRRRGTMAVRHVLDKYTSLASFSEEGGIPFDEISNADVSLPPMGMSPVSNMIKKLDLTEKPNDKKNAALSHAMPRGKSPKQLTIPEGRNTRHRVLSADVRLDQLSIKDSPASNYQEQQFAAQSNFRNREASDNSTPSRRRLTLQSIDDTKQKPAKAADAITDILNVIRQSENGFGGLSVNQRNLLMAELAVLPQSMDENVQPAIQSKQSARVDTANGLDESHQSTFLTHSSQHAGTCEGHSIRSNPLPATLSKERAPPEHRKIAIQSSDSFLNSTALETQETVSSRQPMAAQQPFRPNTQVNARRITLQKISEAPSENSCAKMDQTRDEPLPSNYDPYEEPNDSETSIPPSTISPSPVTQITQMKKMTVINPAPSSMPLEVETMLPDLIRYHIQAKLLEHGLKHDSPNFAKALSWAYHQVASEANSCVGAAGSALHYCCLKRVILFAARLAAQQFR